ncbi:MAG: DoxX family protein [Salibacteraceae bacterium]
MLLLIADLPEKGFSPFLFLTLSFILAFLAILFLQSGIDKLTDYKGNREWLNGHFANSPFKNMVGLLLGTLTLLEMAAGITSAAGAVLVMVTFNLGWSIPGLLLSGVSFLALFLGQRIAKDYPGAASLVPYYMVVVVGLAILAFARAF